MDRSNSTIWKTHILSLVRANGLEDLLDGSKISPHKFFPYEIENSTAEAQVNPTLTIGRERIKCC